jgi:hypothetical protein
VNITQSGYLYNYRGILETLLTYGVDASISHLTNNYWYKDVGDMLPCDPTHPDSKALDLLTGGTVRNNPKKLKCTGEYTVIFVMYRNSYFPTSSCR